MLAVFSFCLCHSGHHIIDNKGSGVAVFGATILIVLDVAPVAAAAKVIVNSRSGTVVIGQSFEVTGEATGKKWIPPKLIIEITDPATGEMVQSVEFHTSCSQPLNVGDQYGGIAVFDFSR